MGVGEEQFRSLAFSGFKVTAYSRRMHWFLAAGLKVKANGLRARISNNARHCSP